MASKRGTSRQHSAATPGYHPGFVHQMLWGCGWDVLFVSLFLCRLLVPAEGVEQGQTLWIAAGWLLAGTVRGWTLWRNGGCRWLPATLLDLGVAGLVGGHLLASLLVLAGTGDRRAALNGFWEWSAVAVMWIILRGALQRPSFRQLLSWGLVVATVTLSGMGLWQHFVWYPQQSRDLSRLVELQEQRESGEPLSRADQEQYEKLRAEFGPEFLMLEPGGRQMLMARTRDSREPIGRFALANSFAALLIVGWFAVCALCLHQLRMPRSRLGLAVSGFCLLLISVCLLLTKSRTGVIGLGVGGLWFSVRTAREAGLSRRQLSLSGGVIVGIGLVLAVALAWAGGLDWQVLSEAPKSLAYRAEYWRSTWDMIQHDPWWGVGVGNFRQHYFAYKLPGASEEILDPHNFLLDVWANGGILALLGMLCLLITWSKQLWQPISPVQATESCPPTTATEGNLLHRGLCLGFVTVGMIVIQEWLLEGFWDRQLMGLATVALGIHLCLTGTVRAGVMTTAAATGTALALWIHLLGAGGIGMPAILQLVLVSVLLGCPLQTLSPAKHPGILAAASGVCGLLTLGALWAGVVPVTSCARLLDQARHELLMSHRVADAQLRFQEAAAADTLSPRPHEELAGLFFDRWEKSPQHDAELFSAAVRELQAAIDRDPRAAKQYLTLSEWWLRRAEVGGDPAAAKSAVAAARSGVELYPHYSRMQAQLAFSQTAAGETAAAQQAAKVALHLDDLNRSRQHTDKVLTANLRGRLETLAGGPQTVRE